MEVDYSLNFVPRNEDYELYYRFKNVIFDKGIISVDYGESNMYKGIKFRNTCFFNSLIGAMKRRGIITTFNDLIEIGKGIPEAGLPGWEIKDFKDLFLDPINNIKHALGIKRITEYFGITVCSYLRRGVTFVYENGGFCYSGKPDGMLITLINNDNVHFEECIFISTLLNIKGEYIDNRFYEGRLIYTEMLKRFGRDKSMENLLAVRNYAVKDFFKGMKNLPPYPELPWETYMFNNLKQYFPNRAKDMGKVFRWLFNPENDTESWLDIDRVLNNTKNYLSQTMKL